MDSFLLCSSAVRKVWLHFHLHKSSEKKDTREKYIYQPIPLHEMLDVPSNGKQMNFYNIFP